LPISHVGSALFTFSRRQFILKQLLRVPSISINLLSVQKFSLDNSVFFEFHSSYFLIKDIQTRAILHQGRIKDGLYQLLPSSSSSSIKQAIVGERAFAASWHKRLGHPSFCTIQHVLSQFHLPVSSYKASSPCSECAQAKGHQQPFSSSSSQICSPLQLILL
jgi:hypothetical protein